MTPTDKITEVRQYIKGNGVFEAKFELVGNNFHKVAGTEVFVRKAKECEMAYTVPQFIVYQQRVCFQC